MLEFSITLKMMKRQPRWRFRVAKPPQNIQLVLHVSNQYQQLLQQLPRLPNSLFLKAKLVLNYSLLISARTGCCSPALSRLLCIRHATLSAISASITPSVSWWLSALSARWYTQTCQRTWRSKLPIVSIYMWVQIIMFHNDYRGMTVSFKDCCSRSWIGSEQWTTLLMTLFNGSLTLLLQQLVQFSTSFRSQWVGFMITMTLISLYVCFAYYFVWLMGQKPSEFMQSHFIVDVAKKFLSCVKNSAIVFGPPRGLFTLIMAAVCQTIPWSFQFF